MKHTWYLAVLMMLVVWGCNDRAKELEQQNAELQQKNNAITQELSIRDEYVDTVTQAINTVYDNLEQARAKEKSILQETKEMESQKKATKEELRGKLLTKITDIGTTLKTDRTKLAELQKKVSAYRSRFTGLTTLVANLKKTIEEREQSIAELELRVRGLEQDVTEKARLITQRDSVIVDQHSTIDRQHSVITTAYYIVGKRDELEKKGIIKKDGGFLWGLLGSSTILANGFDQSDFKPINKVEEKTIEVTGRIDDILPKRNQQFYTKTELGDNRSVISIAEPTNFWQDKYLVIITD